MKLIRPFDYFGETIAFLEDEEWSFEVIVTPSDPDGCLVDIAHLDVDTTDKNAPKTATVMVNEHLLIMTAKSVLVAERYFQQFEEEDEKEIKSEQATIDDYGIKRRAVSIVLEKVMDIVEEWLSDTYEED